MECHGLDIHSLHTKFSYKLVELLIILNTWRACARGVITELTLSVAVFYSSIKHLYYILNMAIGFTLDLEDFQLTDFTEKALLTSYGSYS